MDGKYFYRFHASRPFTFQKNKGNKKIVVKPFQHLQQHHPSAVLHLKKGTEHLTSQQQQMLNIMTTIMNEKKSNSLKQKSKYLKQKVQEPEKKQTSPVPDAKNFGIKESIEGQPTPSLLTSPSHSTPFQISNFEPDDDFFSGRWLFHADCCPQWLQEELFFKKETYQLPENPFLRTSGKEVAQYPQNEEAQKILLDTKQTMEDMFSDASWYSFIDDPSDDGAPSKLKSSKSKLNGGHFFQFSESELDLLYPLRPKPIQHLHVRVPRNIGLTCGSWLFDLSTAPKWFRKELRKPLSSSPPVPNISIYDDIISFASCLIRFVPQCMKALDNLFNSVIA